ncbi:MAG: PAS domain S-box protein [Deltaproteobacteria bacterium]|nr:PAS domain S-box protein [Deltaproteobacteria bacterium]
MNRKSKDQLEEILRLREENSFLRKSLNETSGGQELLRQRKEFSQILKVSQKVVSELNLQKVLNLVAESAREIIEADTLVVPILNKTRDHYIYMAAEGEGAEEFTKLRYKIHVGMCGWVLRNERPLLFGAPSEWWMEEKTPWEEGQQSALLVPLFGREGIIGGLSGLGKQGGGSFTEHDLDLLTLFANQVSVAIANAHLFHEREEIIRNIEEEKERLAVTLRSIGDGVITTDTTGNVVLINKIAEELTGWHQEEATGKPLQEIFHIINEQTRIPCADPVSKVLQLGKICGLANHTLLVAKDGTERIITDSGAPIRDRDSRVIGAILVFRDITEKRKIDSELMKMEKLESLGVLAGGIAHDFNNILVAILGNLSLATETLSPEDKLYPLLQQAEKASLRAQALTKQLLTFSKGGAPIRELASIAEVIQDSCDFALRGKGVRCNYKIPNTLWPVEIDTGQMSQVIQNLILNAAQAMPDGGTINIAAENLALGNSENPSLQASPYIKILIQDSGNGIAPDQIGRIFDPYFTTREDGSGLGLAVTHSIVTKHDGHITVTSKKNRGTTFILYLPAVTEKVPRQKSSRSKTVNQKRGRILVMDDEEIVRDVAAKMLTRFGFEAVPTCSGEEAVKLFREAAERGTPFDLILADLTIPGGMGGKALATEIHRTDPAAKIIASSGYSNDFVMSDYEKFGFCGAVAKPYRLQELQEVVDRILGEEPASSSDAAGT